MSSAARTLLAGWLLTLALLAGGACPGEMVILNKDRGLQGGAEQGSPRSDQRPASADRLLSVDLPVTPGVPCFLGACGPDLICMANICLKMCIQPMPGCNDKVDTCGPDEACMYGSSFTDACYPALAALGELCDYTKALYCKQGNLCVQVDTADPRCLKLCKYGCPSGTHCGQTNNHCDICIPN